MATVDIRKKSLYTWEHFYDGRPVYVTNVFNINNGGNETFNIVEYRGAKLDSVPIANVTVYDDTGAGTPETFSTFSQLNTRLGVLEYPPFRTSGGGGGGGTWGSITGTLSAQTDLQNALDLKEDEANKATDLTSPDNIKYPTTLLLKNEIDAISFEVSNVLENEILENGLIYQVPNIDGGYSSSGNVSQYLRLFNAPVVQNSVTDNFFGLSCGVFQTTAVTGTIAGIRRNDGINLQTFNNLLFVRDFQVDANISNDCRYIVGVSKNYQFAFPTNNDPSVHTECIYVAKLSTSNNLHIVHNDNGGTATTIDLGANFPANSDLYKYRFSLTKRSASDYDVKIYRRTLSTGVILESATYNLTTNLPTAGGALQQILAITNNATATNMRIGDYGLTLKKLPL